jgi:hypothetical protein
MAALLLTKTSSKPIKVTALPGIHFENFIQIPP